MTENIRSAAHTRNAIIRIAKTEVNKKGINRIEMKDIAQKAKIGRSTLYRYFPQKEQLAFVLILDIMNELMEKCFYIVFENTLTGYEKVETYCRQLIHMLLSRPMLCRYLADFDKMFTEEYPSIPEVQTFIELVEKNIAAVSRCVEEGVVDGSIYLAGDPTLYSATLSNTILGLGQRMVPRGKHISDEQGVEVEVIMNKAIDMLLDNLKPRDKG